MRPHGGTVFLLHARKYLSVSHCLTLSFKRVGPLLLPPTLLEADTYFFSLSFFYILPFSYFPFFLKKKKSLSLLSLSLSHTHTHSFHLHFLSPCLDCMQLLCIDETNLSKRLIKFKNYASLPSPKPHPTPKP